MHMIQYLVFDRQLRKLPTEWNRIDKEPVQKTEVLKTVVQIVNNVASLIRYFVLI